MIGRIEDIPQFRRTVRGWLKVNAPDSTIRPFTDGGLAELRRWERLLHKEGLAALHWPRQYGGMDASVKRQFVFQEEYIRAGAPERLNRLGLGMAGPTVIEFGTTEQKDRWLPGILNCDELWCQGFSEPEAGSDLASLSTRADRDGDYLIINGQKTWVSLATLADWMFTLVRTDKNRPKHHGITFLMVPLSAKGVEVRPIRQLHGEPGFCEVFFKDVMVPVGNIIGDLNQGWSVAKAALGFERATGLGNHLKFSKQVREAFLLARAVGAFDDHVIREQLVDAFVETEVFRHHMHVVTERLGREEVPGAASSVTKLFWSDMQARTYELMMEILGPAAEVVSSSRRGVLSSLHRDYWHARAARIFAGTNEIQKNIIAERVLGLPRNEEG